MFEDDICKLVGPIMEGLMTMSIAQVGWIRRAFWGIWRMDVDSMAGCQWERLGFMNIILGKRRDDLTYRNSTLGGIVVLYDLQAIKNVLYMLTSACKCPIVPSYYRGMLGRSSQALWLRSSYWMKWRQQATALPRAMNFLRRMGI